MSQNEFIFEPLTMKNAIEIREMVRLFLETEPMTKLFNLTENDKLIFIDTVMKTTIPENLSFGAFLKSTNELVGCVINSSGKNRISPDTYDTSQFKYSPNMEALIRFDESMEQDIPNYVGSNNFLTFELAVIKAHHQGKGLMRNLHNLGEGVAVSRGFDAISATATSFKSHQTVCKRGFTVIKNVFYKEYIDEVLKTRPLYEMKEEKAMLNLKILRKPKL